MNRVQPDVGLVQPAPPLVEIQWFWRRLWVFVTTLGCLALLGVIIAALGFAGVSPEQAGPLAGVAYALIAFLALIGLIYIVGATAYELTQLVASARIDLAAIRVGQ